MAVDEMMLACSCCCVPWWSEWTPWKLDRERRYPRMLGAIVCVSPAGRVDWMLSETRVGGREVRMVGRRFLPLHDREANGHSKISGELM